MILRRSPVHFNRPLGLLCPTQEHPGVRAGGRARFRCLTQARAMKVNLWKSKRKQLHQEDSVAGDPWATTAM
jgi:hypothetical protein